MIVIKKFRPGLFIMISMMMLILSCNKEPQQFQEEEPQPISGETLGEVISANPNDSLYYRLIVRGGMANLINSPSNAYTMFVPDNNAMKQFINAASGGAVPLNAPDAVFSGFITGSLPAASAASIVGYNIIPQALRANQFGNNFPNFQYPTILNPAPQLSSLLRLTTFPSARNGNWINNVPLLAVDQEAANGIIHRPAAVVVPPSRYLWDRINSDPQLTYLRAAILRADSATSTGSTPGTLQGALLNIGANLTVFAPTDAAFQTILTGAIAQALIAMGVPPATAMAQATALASTPAVFENPMLYPVLTAQNVQGIVVYHILGQRAFTNNFPTTAGNFPTLLNGAIPSHPGVELNATFGVPFVTAATVKGSENPSASNIIINASPLTPDPVGTSDQHFLNGVLHKIDQVLIPVPL